MSAAHLASFLQDLKSINPQFRFFTSSTRGLVVHLMRSKRQSSAMTLEQALAHCGSKSGGLAKYRPAIQRLVTVWGKGNQLIYPMGQDGKRLQGQALNRLCFRGDSRPPPHIFAHGFDKKNQGTEVEYRNFVAQTAKDVNPHVRGIAGMTKAGDVDPFSAVCVTPDMDVAALFPAPTSDNFTEVTWLYLVLARQGYNTHGRQVLDALRGFKQKATHELGRTAPQVSRDRVDAIAMLLYGRELSLDSVAPVDVLLAMPIRRYWTQSIVTPSPVPGQPPRQKGDFWAGGQYCIEDVVVSDLAVSLLDTEHLVQVLRFEDSALSDAINQTRLTLPTPDSGYVESTRT